MLVYILQLLMFIYVGWSGKCFWNLYPISVYNEKAKHASYVFSYIDKLIYKLGRFLTCPCYRYKYLTFPVYMS